MSFLKKSGKAIADVVPGLGRFKFDPADAGAVFITSGTTVFFGLGSNLMAEHTLKLTLSPLLF
jgi:hypothetical protein